MCWSLRFCRFFKDYGNRGKMCGESQSENPALLAALSSRAVHIRNDAPSQSFASFVLALVLIATFKRIGFDREYCMELQLEVRLRI